ncbi:MAG: winged helix-turn-helix domain-containing protein, partial [Candidatus Latescibacterota bacterium]|nr:winged helix-turn-helix domain-containing protein [Candidatus Latescibacterota bacterium]
DTHLRRLRAKMGEAADYLETVRGVGYRFRREGR